MLSDLTVLAPPFLVCAAFLIAVGAFIRYEMRNGGQRGDDDEPEESMPLSADRNLTGDSQNPVGMPGDAVSGRPAGVDGQEE